MEDFCFVNVKYDCFFGTYGSTPLPRREISCYQKIYHENTQERSDESGSSDTKTYGLNQHVGFKKKIGVGRRMPFVGMFNVCSLTSIFN